MSIRFRLGPTRLTKASAGQWANDFGDDSSTALAPLIPGASLQASLSAGASTQQAAVTATDTFTGSAGALSANWGLQDYGFPIVLDGSGNAVSSSDGNPSGAFYLAQPAARNQSISVTIGANATSNAVFSLFLNYSSGTANYQAQIGLFDPATPTFTPECTLQVQWDGGSSTIFAPLFSAPSTFTAGDVVTFDRTDGVLTLSVNGTALFSQTVATLLQGTGIVTVPDDTTGYAGFAIYAITAATDLKITSATIASKGTPLTVAAGPVTRSPAAGSVTLAGVAPAAIRGTIIAVPAGTITCAGQAPAAVVGTIATPAQGTVTIAGIAPTALRGQVFQPATGAITITGPPPALLFGMPVGAGAVTLAGQAPTVVIGSIATPGAGAITVSGRAPTLVLGTVAAPGAGAITLTGQAPTAAVSSSAAPTLSATTATAITNTTATPRVTVTF